MSEDGDIPAPEPTKSEQKKVIIYRNGVPVFPSTGEVITMEMIQAIMDEEGI